MRTRSRLLTTPTDSWGVDCLESFEDDNTRPMSREWKRCSHHISKVIAAEHGFWRFALNGSSVGAVEVKAFEPLSTHTSFLFGFYREDLEDYELTLPRIDLRALAFERSRSSTNLAEVVATFKDTLGLFSRPFAFCKHLKKVRAVDKAGTMKNAKDAINRAADTWLQGTYGYLPFMQDLGELSEIARNPLQAVRLAKEAALERQAIHQSNTVTVKSKRPEDMHWNHGYIRSTNVITAKRKVTIHWREVPAFSAMSAANQIATYMGLNDAGRLAWELVPYSFVVDWFTNLGKEMAATDALNGHMMVASGAVLVGTKNTRISFETGYMGGEIVSGDPWSFLSVVHNSRTTKTEDYSRDIVIGDAIDGLCDAKGLTTYRTATGLALLIGSATNFARFLKGKYK